MHTVVETPSYLRAAKEAGMTVGEMAEAVNLVSRTPEAGDLMEGTGGARKLRLAGRGKGKSGGYRVITYYCAENVPVFLLDVFGKGDKTNLSKAERNTLKAVLANLAEDWRRSMRQMGEE